VDIGTLQISDPTLRKEVAILPATLRLESPHIISWSSEKLYYNTK
jgi:hypothetical protein